MTAAGYVERDVQVGDLRLHFQEWGDSSSPAMLLVHGFGVSGHMFDEFAQRMQDRYHLIALDQRGHGDSDWASDGDYSREAFVADLEGFRAAVGIDRFVLVGHSMGGLNSAMYTTQHPDRVRALVLVDVGPESAKTGVDNIVRFTRGPDDLEFEQFVEMTHKFNPRRTRENIEERMRHRLKPTENGKWTWKFDKRFRDPESGLRIGGSQSNDDAWAMFRSISVPVLLVRGSESDVLSPEVAERAAIEMQHAKLVTIAGAGHSVPGDNPAEFTEAVATFLSDLESGGVVPPPPSVPLEVRVESEEVVGRRPGLRVIVAGGLAAGIVIAGVVILIRTVMKPSTPPAKQRAGRAKKHLADQAHAIAAPAHARDLVHSLSESGRRSLDDARALLDEVDVEAAIAAARHAVASAPAAVEPAIHAAAATTAKKGKQAKKRAGAARASLRLAGKGAKLLLQQEKQKPKKRRSLLRRLAGV